MTKLFSALTKNNHAVLVDVPLNIIREKLEMDLADLIEANILEPGQSLNKYLKIKADEQAKNILYSSERESRHYLIKLVRSQ